MKILIIEAYSAANVGSGALVENSVSLLQDLFPEANIDILAQHPSSIHQLTKLPCFHEVISLPLKQSRLRQIAWLGRTGLWMAAHTGARRIEKTGIHVPEGWYTHNQDTRIALEKIQAADMVVSVGAERINDNFYKAILFSLYMLWIVKDYKKCLVLFPQTIGPFHFRLTRWLSGVMLRKCDLVFLRDRRSRVIMEEIRATGVHTIDTCDVAILQPAVSTEEAWRLLDAFHVERNKKPLIGISAMKWDYIKAEGKSDYETYKKAIATVADGLIDQLNARIVFIATNILTEGCREDDAAAAEDIVSLMAHKGGVVILNQVYTPAQLKGIMGVLDLALVTRMHACIFSTGIYTPTVSINYQFKLKEYMSLMGLDDYTVDIDVVTIEQLKRLMELAWENRMESRDILKVRVNGWKQKLSRDMKQLPNLLSQWKGNSDDCATT